MKTRCQLFVLIFAVLFFLTNILGVNSEQLSINTDYIESDGWGAAPENELNPGRARLLARRAAIVDAYRNIGEQVNSVRVTAETTVADAILQSDVVKTNMSAVIKGAAIKSEEFRPDGTYHVKMTIPKFGEQSIASAIFSEITPITPEPFLQPSYQESSSSAKHYKAQGSYTGLIIDCSGLGLEPVMSPTIIDTNGRTIYGHKNLNPDFIVKYGMADYAKKGVSSLSRAGTNPLTVKAIKLESHNAKPVIAVEDANMILLENQTANFLDKTSVVFVK